jgi:GLPGLI family protein
MDHGLIQNIYMKNLFSTLAFILLAITQTTAQRVVADCTITYAISTEEGNADKDVTESLKASTKTVYIKGNDSRTDLVSPSFTQSLLYNKTTGNAVILREFGNNKFMTRLDNAKWMAENKRYEGMTVALAGNETKTILGYECKKAVIQMKDGSSFVLYYAPAIAPSVKEFEYQFKDVPGFVLEFESQEADSKKIKYTATKINLSPVQASRFDVPTSGYRLLN